MCELLTKTERDTYWSVILNSNFNQKFLLGKMTIPISVKFTLVENILGRD